MSEFSKGLTVAMRVMSAQKYRIAELEAAQNWQPISEAPRDGTYVWLYEGSTTRKTWRGKWDDGLQGWVMGATSDDHTVCVLYKLSPTHWMPLPKPPGDKE